VIRQAISCDICGNEKKQTNHWFVTYEQSGELRVSGWSSRNRLRPGTKHLCGQTCLHKLVDDYMARAIGQKTQSASHAEVETSAIRTDTSLTSHAAYGSNAHDYDVEFESSARLITSPPPSLPIPPAKAAPELVTMGGKERYASSSRRAEAWERERVRESRNSDCHDNDVALRRANGR
jgi:hypothetical protein